MSRIIDSGLEEESVILNKMAELAYETLTLSIEGYLKAKSVQTEVEEMSDMLVALADKVEDKSFELISRFQPVASDLRTIKSYMKIATDFARFGRYSFDISIINDEIKGLTECKPWAKNFIAEMSEKVLAMAKISIDSLRKLDVTLAKTISEPEHLVDKMYIDFFHKQIDEEKINRKCIISSALVTRYLERVADHATYVCESIVYIVTGEKITLT